MKSNFVSIKWDRFLREAEIQDSDPLESDDMEDVDTYVEDEPDDTSAVAQQGVLRNPPGDNTAADTDDTTNPSAYVPEDYEAEDFHPTQAAIDITDPGLEHGAGTEYPESPIEYKTDFPKGKEKWKKSYESGYNKERWINKISRDEGVGNEEAEEIYNRPGGHRDQALAAIETPMYYRSPESESDVAYFQADETAPGEPRTGKIYLDRQEWASTVPHERAHALGHVIGGDQATEEEQKAAVNDLFTDLDPDDYSEGHTTAAEVYAGMTDRALVQQRDVNARDVKNIGTGRWKLDPRLLDTELGDLENAIKRERALGNKSDEEIADGINKFALRPQKPQKAGAEATVTEDLISRIDNYLKRPKKYLLERKTDQLYRDLVNFFVEMYTTPANYEYLDEAEEEEYEGAPITDHHMMALFGELDEGIEDVDAPECNHCSEMFFLKVPRMAELWHKFIEQVPGGAPFLNFENEHQFTDRMAESGWLEIVYGMENAEGVSEEALKSSALGMYAGGQLLINFGSKLMGDWTPDKFKEASADALLAALAEKHSVIRAVIEHELTHMINHLRSGTYKRAKGIGRHHRQKKEELQGAIRYANSTEEIQARLIPIFNFVGDIVSAVGSSQAPSSAVRRGKNSTELANLIGHEVKNFEGNQSLKNIVKLLWSLHDQENPNWERLLSQKNRRRISHRFYEFAEELVSNETPT